MLSVPEVLCRLVANAGRYFPELGRGPVRASLKQRHERNASSLWHIELVAQDRPRLRRAVVVKWPWLRDAPREKGAQHRHDGLANGSVVSPSQLPQATDRPRLVPLCPPAEKCRREYEALRTIERRFAADATGRFAVMRPLEHWADDGALVMEEMPYPSLRASLSPSLPTRGPNSPALASVMNNAGAWLRAFHELPPGSARPRHTRPQDLVDYVTRLADYLDQPTHHVGSAARRSPELGGWRSGVLHRAADYVRRFAAACLPEQLPLGLGHGDFAPRNLFVLPGGRVAGFDTLARWQPPIYEDLGDFLADVWTRAGWSFRLRPRVRQMRELEEAFLSGYFGKQGAPRAAIGLYEIQSLLAKWVGAEHRRRMVTGWRRALAVLAQPRIAAYVRRLEALLSELPDYQNRRSSLPLCGRAADEGAKTWNI